jgi:phosphoglycerol transferase MdoB-like AlkP superfamily enzyme
VTTLLRWIRACVGVLALMQAISLLPVLKWVNDFGGFNLGMVMIALYKMIFLVLCVMLYGYMRRVINRRMPELLKGSFSL